MFRYADPLACPGCRAPLEYGAARCDSCHLALTGWRTERLFTLLATADTELAHIRESQARPEPVNVHRAATTTEPIVVPLYALQFLLAGVGAVSVLAAAFAWVVRRRRSSK